MSLCVTLAFNFLFIKTATCPQTVDKNEKMRLILIYIINTDDD